MSVPGSDAALLNAIRSGDPGAYSVLRARHGAAARRLASHLPRGSASADDVVDWAFAQVLDAIRRGGGPTDAFRPYLLTATSRAARDCDAGIAAPVPTDEQDIPDPGQLVAGLAGDPTVSAFLSLPERWRAVLWHTEVEGAAPGAVASLFGLSAADTAELAAAARDGLARSAEFGSPDASPERAAQVAAALRSSVALVVLGPAASDYLTEAALETPVPDYDADYAGGGYTEPGSPVRDYARPDWADPADSAPGYAAAGTDDRGGLAPDDALSAPGRTRPGRPSV